MVLEKFNSPLVERDIPAPDLAPGELLVRITASGVCGSDVRMHAGEDPRTPVPMILGHESVGVIEEVAGSVDADDGLPLKPGTPVAWDRGVYCGRCFFCNRGDEHLCPGRRAYGIHYGGVDGDEPPPLKGGYATHIVLSPGTAVFRLPEGADHEALVSASCSGATAAHSVEEAEVRPGDVVLVQGLGPLGLWTAALAAAAGARVLAIGRRPRRLALALDLGAELALDEAATEPDERREAVMARTEDLGADAVMDTTGVAAAAREGLDLVRRGGVYVNSGVAVPAGEFPLRLYEDLALRNVAVRGVWVSGTDHFAQALGLALSGKYPLSQLVTHRLPLAEANEALDAAASDPAAVKVVLKP